MTAPAALAAAEEDAARFIAASPDPPRQYTRQRPFGKQRAFLSMNFATEVLFGGAAGPGKSSGLLMAALQYVDVPGYAAILLRRTYTELTLPGALLDRAHEWLDGTDAHWSETRRTFTFPSGATLTLSYLAGPRDHLQYQSAEFQFVGFDELTAFTERQYTFMFSRLRKPSSGPLAAVPLRARSASNPGGPGHTWVQQYFGIGTPRVSLTPEQQQRIFLPARFTDNPHLDQRSYRRMLSRLDPVTRARLERGDWTIRESGGLFKREYFRPIQRANIPSQIRWVRAWDLAGTEAKPGTDPDYTVGWLMGEGPQYGGLPGDLYIADVVRFREEPGETERRILATAAADGPRVPIRMEQEPGSSGKGTVRYYARQLRGYDFAGQPSTGSKVERARPFSAAAANGQVHMVEGAWNTEMLDEFEIFPQEGAHDDQVDAGSLAFDHFNTGDRTVHDE